MLQITMQADAHRITTIVNLCSLLLDDVHFDEIDFINALSVYMDEVNVFFQTTPQDDLWNVSDDVSQTLVHLGKKLVYIGNLLVAPPD